MMAGELSAHDLAILDCCFYPNLPLLMTGLENAKDTNEADTGMDCNNSANTEQPPSIIETMEIAAVQLAERGDLDAALATINKAIEMSPANASLFNNRAHIYQFQRKFKEAFNDLTQSIQLLTPCGNNNKRQKTVLCQAYCQRGVLHRRADRMALAKEDFEVAAALGSQFAKSQLVALNPYAALCNQMLRKVMDKI